MGKPIAIAVIVTFIVLTAEAQVLFTNNFQVTYGGDHVQPSTDGQSVRVTLDKESGANFKSTKTFTFGGFSSQIQLPAGNSAGTCTAYFLSSDGPNHDELDYEFLGNVTGQPFIIQTNVFANGVGGREERIYLWFDPSVGFHTYTVVWNPQQVTFLIDNVPIRVYGNYAGVGYPTQAMAVYAALFDASSWATRGGRDPVDYTQGPIGATYRNFGLDGCTNSVSTCSADTSSWWSQSSYKTLSSNQVDQLRWVRRNYLKYSYCTDVARNPVAPVECALNAP